MLRLIVLCISLSLLICCAKPGTIKKVPTAEEYEYEINKLKRDVEYWKNETKNYSDLYLEKQKQLDGTYETDNSIYGQFDRCSNMMGEMFGFVRGNKNLTNTDRQRIEFIGVLHDHAYDWDEANKNYKPENETESGGDGNSYQDGEDDYEE